MTESNGIDEIPVGERLRRLRQQEPNASADAGTGPIALVAGEVVTELPTDLYIPPQALEVFLETFEGPLDLLLYLIRRENLDILDIRVAEITRQYMSYIELMTALQLELAAEYLVMAALLAEIKSRMLLPRVSTTLDDEDDPRAELIRRLQAYEQLKTTAEQLDEIPRMEREIFPAWVQRPDLIRHQAQPDVDMRELLMALSRVMHRADMYQHHAVQLEPLSVRERMTSVLDRLNEVPDEFLPFVSLFNHREGRLGVIVTFLAIMELVRERLASLVQNAPFAPIYVRAAGPDESDAALYDDEQDLDAPERDADVYDEE